MPIFRDITDKLSNDAAILTLLPYEMTLNRRAVELLGLGETNYLKVATDLEELNKGRDRVYVYASDTPGYKGQGRAFQRRYCNRALCTELAKHLDGYGRYRICEEVYVDSGKVRHYEIFFKRYA